jgi:2-keto-3-deoxy-6-phosphogluconate aldolase
MKAEFLADLTDAKLIFILRVTTMLDLDSWVDAAVEGGARWLEITFPTPGGAAGNCAGAAQASRFEHRGWHGMHRG